MNVNNKQRYVHVRGGVNRDGWLLRVEGNSALIKLDGDRCAMNADWFRLDIIDDFQDGDYLPKFVGPLRMRGLGL